MIRCYISSPYTLGSEGENVRISLKVADELINEGFAPFAPLLSHFQHMMFPQDYEVWMSLDLEWIGACDCLLRLSGESAGADRGVEFARSNEIPVFYTINQMVEYYNDLENEN